MGNGFASLILPLTIDTAYSLIGQKRLAEVGSVRDHLSPRLTGSRIKTRHSKIRGSTRTVERPGEFRPWSDTTVRAGEEQPKAEGLRSKMTEVTALNLTDTRSLPQKLVAISKAPVILTLQPPECNVSTRPNRRGDLARPFSERREHASRVKAMTSVTCSPAKAVWLDPRLFHLFRVRRVACCRGAGWEDSRKDSTAEHQEID